MHIGQVIRVLRIQRSLTQEELALEAQVATSNVSRIENGLRQPSQDLLQRLAKVLEVTVSQIYAMSEESAFSHGAENLESLTVEASGDISLEFADNFILHSLPIEPPLAPEVLALIKYFQQLTPENKTLALEHIKLLKRLQNNEE